MKMCEAMAENGAEVELVIPERFNENKENPFDHYGIKKIFSIKKIGKTDFINYRFLPRILAFLLETIYFSAKSFSYLKSIKENYLVYARDREIAWLCLFLKKPFIWEIHFLPKMLFIYKPVLKRLFKIATITGYMKNKLAEAGIRPEKIVFLPDAVDLEKFTVKESKQAIRKKLNLPADKKIIMYSGQLYGWKGVDTLVKASNFLSNNFNVVIVGGHDNEIEELRKIPHKNILFAGQKNNKEVPFWLKAADILVLPNSGKYEISRHFTSPMKLFEYMASGVPIVSSDLPSLREILTEDEAIFFRPDSAGDLGAVLLGNAGKEEFLKKISGNALKKVQKYTWKNRTKEVIGGLESVLVK